MNAEDKKYLAEIAANNNNWFDKPMRFANLTLVENDPGLYDLQFWLDYLKKTHIDCVTLSAGGIVAYYPTNIPFHRRSSWLGDMDPFGDLVLGARKLGIAVIARNDCQAVHQAAYEAHPEWILEDVNGNKLRHWENKELWVPCIFGSYGFDFMTEVYKEIMSNYSVDAVFNNHWGQHSTCYCENCRREFKKAYGMDLPRTFDVNDPQRSNYMKWSGEKMFQLINHWDSAVKKINPNSRFNPNTGHEKYQIDMVKLGEYASILNVDKQGRSGHEPVWSIGRTGKIFRSILGKKPVAGGYSIAPEGSYRWKDGVQGSPEMRIWHADGLASGMRPSWGKFSGVVYDTRWMKTIEDIFSWHHKWEKYMRNEESITDVGLVYGQLKEWGIFESHDIWGPKAVNFSKRGEDDNNMGMYHALVESRIPFDMVHVNKMDLEAIKKYKLLILPNITDMSDKQCEQIRQFVKQGGSIVTTYETSINDENGIKRGTFGLSDLFGVNYKASRGPVKNSYIKIEKDRLTGKYHPILEGLEDANRIINGSWQLDVEPIEKVENTPLTLIPAYPHMPMEDCYPRCLQTDVAQVYLREIGDSRIVYFPWNIDQTFWEAMFEDHLTLLSNSVKWALNREKLISVEGSGLIDISVWQQKESMTVHIVNLTNPRMFKAPFRELVPIGEQKVRVCIPTGKKVTQVRLLVTEVQPDFELDGDYLNISVPSILVNEVIAIDLV